MPPQLLAIDDDPAGARLLQAIFSNEGFEVALAHDGRSGLRRAREAPLDLVFLDLHLPDMDGFEILEQLRAIDPSLPVVMLTAHGEVRSAVRATQLGARDYLTKPIDPDDIVVVAKRVLRTRALEREVEELRRQVGGNTNLHAQMGPSAEVARIVERVAAVAKSGFSVLVLGETGTGKDLVAQAIHRASDRADAPFVALDCGAIPEPLLESELFGHEKGAFTGADKKREGRFHLAAGGTLFLDEIGNLPLALQAKLLRTLESREVHSIGASKATAVDVRFVAATNDDLQASAARGAFRSDLYFRLAQYTIQLPPLRRRSGDIAYLATRFMTEAGVELRRPMRELDPQALAALEAHAWPGNVRELKNVVRQAVLDATTPVLTRAIVERVLAGVASTRPVTRTEAPPPTGGSLREIADAASRDAERRAIEATLQTTSGNKSKAARLLQTDYKTLHTKMKSLGIDAKRFRGS
jgi:two-component system nitrogen regulation response regulator GlnG